MLISQAQALTWGTEEKVKPVIVLSRMSMGWRQEQSPSGAHVISVVLQHLKALLCCGGSFSGHILPGFLAFSFFSFQIICSSFAPSPVSHILGQCSVFSYFVLNHSGARGGWHFVYTSAVLLPFLEPLLQPTKFTASFLLLFSSLLNSLLHPIPSPVALHFPLS